MNSKLLIGKQIVDKELELLKKRISKLKVKLILVAISVGNNENSKIYLENKKVMAEKVGINFENHHFEKSTTEEIVDLIKKLNNRKDVDAIIVQLPLPKQLDKDIIINTIDPNKDVDAFTSINKGKLDLGIASLVPCTPKGIMDLLNYYKISLIGKYVVIVGSSEVVGMPLFKLLINAKATVTMCNINTKNLGKFTKQADILVLATGEKNLITRKDIKKDSIVINVGITRTNGIIYGDIDYKKVISKVKYITPTPGGVGPFTILNLLKNTLICHNLK